MIMMRSIQKLLRRRKSAFTLIELIMTIVVVGIVAVPMSLMLGAHLNSLFYSKDLTMANNLARFEMEVVNNLPYANVTNANFSSYQGYAYDVNRSISYINGNAASSESTKQITIQVKKANQSAVLLELNSYVSKNVRYPY